MKLARVVISLLVAGSVGQTFLACSDSASSTPTADATGASSDAAVATDAGVSPPADGAPASDATTVTDAGSDASDGSDGSDGSPAVDAGCTPPDATFAGCVTFDDQGATAPAAASIAFGGAIGLAYSPPCLKVKVNQQVNWVGTFGLHPLAAATCNPASGGTIPATSSGSTASTTFTAPGFYGYYCTVHGDGLGGGMAGVIQVY